MKKILVTSYLAGIKEQFNEFMSKSKFTSKEILFIPTAGNVEDYTGYIDEGIQLLEGLGYELTVFDISKESQNKCHQAIANANTICFSGGNSFYLLQEIKRKHLVSLLKEKINSDCLYIGESAGGIILSENISYSNIMDPPTLAPELTDYSGLGLVDFYPLPHYKEEPFTETAQEIFEEYHNRINLIPINNNQAILVDDIKIEIV
jgi:dipeptidase E